MKKREYKKSKNVYALVEVESGIPVQVRLFNTLSDAKEKETTIRKNINPDNDETAVFKLKL
jgi:hypothetical protein